MMSIFSSLIGNAGIVDSDKLKQTYAELLIPGEDIEIGFKLLRDTFVFTTKRLILIDKQGITGKKMEYLSINYNSISRFSIETSGTFDLDAELKIWISSESHPSISRRFDKSVNVYDVQRILAKNVLK